MVAKKLPRSKKNSLHANSDAPKRELKQPPNGLTCASLEPCDTFTGDVPLKLSVRWEGEIIKFFERHKTKRKALHDKTFEKISEHFQKSQFACLEDDLCQRKKLFIWRISFRGINKFCFYLVIVQ